MSWYREHIEKGIIDVYVTNKRSPKWRKVRSQFVKDNPKCAVCNSKKKLQVHHIEDFSTNPSLELEPSNLMTLCMHNKCHILFGHLGYWKSINYDLKHDAMYMNTKIRNRR